MICIDSKPRAGTFNAPLRGLKRSGRSGRSLIQTQWEAQMNKGQLIEAVAAELDTSKAAASRAVDAVIASITSGIKRDQGVTIVGFGSFAKKHRSPRVVRNPSTGEPMEISATTTVGFKPAQALKEEMA
jgi:DNA-binding protein HU-beta